MAPEKQIAFALGGLAGNNAHGAGFLQAALEKSIEPKMISCSSGQILWVFRYLQDRGRKEQAAGLRKMLERDIRDITPTGSFDLDTMLLFLFGKNHVFRPAFQEFTMDLFRNGARFVSTVLEKGPRAFVTKEFLQSIPGRLLVPEFQESFFKDISDTLNDNAHKIGIAFNSYDPREGIELVYLNKEAKRLQAVSKSKYRGRTEYRDITPDAVRDALWLYEYGFDQEKRGHLDGAYYRQIILSELAFADDIFIARPVNHCLPGRLPTSHVGIEDLKTKVGFNGSYAGERDKINLINKLVKKGALKKPYKTINLHEVEMECSRGFFDYIYESIEVFDSALKCSKEKFEGFLSGMQPVSESEPIN